MSYFNIYNNKTIFVTGHTGFKGSWLITWLNKLGAKVIGISNSLPSDPCNFEASNLSKVVNDQRLDIRDFDSLNKLFHLHKPDFIFHLAAQALVRQSYEYPLDTISSNTMGCANILEAIRIYDRPIIGVIITSDKVYQNMEWNKGYVEDDKIGGKDPYSASKGMTELMISSYVESFFNKPNKEIRIGIARAGNVIGGGDWAKDRLVPDCIRAWSKNEIVKIRYPNSTRPWQHVLEPISGYLTLGADLYSRSINHGEAFNFGPKKNQDHSVKELINEINKYWNTVNWKDISKTDVHHHEAGLLKLNCQKAHDKLEWFSVLDFKETIKLTIEWYKDYYDNPNKDMKDISNNQIDQYCKIAKSLSIKWAL